MKNKICNGKLCKGKEKSLTEFHKNKNRKDGVAVWCKECVKEYNKEYEKRNKILRKEQKKKYYIKHKKKILKKCKNYRDENKEKIAKYQSSRYKNNKKEILEQTNEYRRNRMKFDIIYKLKDNLRRRLNGALVNNSKSKRTLELLGCTVEELKKYLESQFTSGMTWDNHGFGDDKWHIDHKIPCASFDLSDPKQQDICFNYTNLQPLWQIDNLRKGSKI